MALAVSRSLSAVSPSSAPCVCGYVMGKDLLDNAEAWHLYDQLREDRQVVFLSEAPGFQQHWRTTALEIKGGSHAWTDRYIASFASHKGSTVVTFDKSFKKVADCRMLC